VAGGLAIALSGAVMPAHGGSSRAQGILGRQQEPGTGASLIDQRDARTGAIRPRRPFAEARR